MAMTFEELKEKLKRLDEVTLLELLGVDSEALVETFQEQIEARFEKLEKELNDCE